MLAGGAVSIYIGTLSAGRICQKSAAFAATSEPLFLQLINTWGKRMESG